MAQPTTRRAIITARMDTLSTPGRIGGIDIGHEAIGGIIEAGRVTGQSGELSLKIRTAAKPISSALALSMFR